MHQRWRHKLLLIHWWRPIHRQLLSLCLPEKLVKDMKGNQELNLKFKKDSQSSVIWVISKSGPWKRMMSDKIPNVRHLIILRPDRQSTLILLFMALSSLDINKMASKNLFYINRACLQDRRGVFEIFWNFILVKISAFDIPKFRVRDFGTPFFERV